MGSFSGLHAGLRQRCLLEKRDPDDAYDAWCRRGGDLQQQGKKDTHLRPLPPPHRSFRPSHPLGQNFKELRHAHERSDLRKPRFYAAASCPFARICPVWELGKIFEELDSSNDQGLRYVLDLQWIACPCAACTGTNDAEFLDGFWVLGRFGCWNLGDTQTDLE